MLQNLNNMRVAMMLQQLLEMQIMSQVAQQGRASSQSLSQYKGHRAPEHWAPSDVDHT